VLFGYRSVPAKAGLASTLLEHLETKHIVYATLITVILTTAILRVAGMLLIICVGIFALAAKKYFHRRLGGITGDTFGAVGELSETSIFVCLALVR
jgi:adenosylcobinamide-GDP ribazoletransferase